MQGTNTPAVGIDFGTTNSSVALAAADGSVRFAQFAAPGGLTASSRSLLYLQRQSTRPGKPVRVWSGPEAIARHLEHDPFDDDVQGRLIQSLKSYLAARSFTGTEIFGRHYRMEDLLAKMLGDLRVRASEAFGIEVTRAVAGRPVWFVNADTEDDNAFAEERLRAAFLQAGWTDVQFALEPVGAAHSYAARLAGNAAAEDTAAQRAGNGDLLLVGDFGGGTTDFTLVRMGAAGERHTVLRSTGVGLAGDAFDARIVRYAVAPAFGFGSVERALPGVPDKRIPALPAWIYTSLERWHLLSFLQTRQTMELLRTAEMRAAEPEKIAALRTLVQRDLGYRLHGAVQRAKVELSRSDSTEFVFREEGLDVRVQITRGEFEEWIAPELGRIQASLDALLQEAGATAGDVGHVFLTGGTSLVPAVRRVFTAGFPGARMEQGEVFTSVAHGLAQLARAELG
ncbi:Hsp70 family protein [Terriglobus aquaticus]|uniref:Hsp70 family protein n=1 Tax=Terriglobus aquaticus TaxID=940139 RepID=A0ABW9KGJ1_9BACT|nr:Hsp70 family protein [Terriglobus aquaticus]